MEQTEAGWPEWVVWMVQDKPYRPDFSPDSSEWNSRTLPLAQTKVLKQQLL